MVLVQECSGWGRAVHVSDSRAWLCQVAAQEGFCWSAPLLGPEPAVAVLLGLCLGWLSGLLLALFCKCRQTSRQVESKQVSNQ